MKLLTLFLVLLSLSSCSFNPYAARGSDKTLFGYYDTQISDSTYRIAYVGDQNTMDEMTDRYTLYHAAEVTVAHGARYFTIANHFGEQAFHSTVSRSPFSRLFLDERTERTALKTIRISNSHPSGDTVYYDAPLIVANMPAALDQDKKLSTSVPPLLTAVILISVIVGGVILLNR